MVKKQTKVIEHRRIEGLRGLNGLQSTLIENLPYPSMLIRKDRTVLFANNAALEAGAKVGGQCWRDFTHGDYIPDADKSYIKQHKKKPPEGTRCTFCLADIALKDHRTAIAPEVHIFGEIWEVYWIPVSEDVFLHYALNITDRKQAESEIKESRDFLQKVIDGIPDEVIVINPDYRVLLVNDAVRKATGNKHIYRDMPCYQVLHHRDSPCIEPGCSCPLRDVLKTGKKTTVIHTHSDVNDNKKFIEISASPIRNDSGEIIHIVESCRNVTERVQAEDAMLDKNKEMESLLRIISHDLRSPLVNIQGFSKELMVDCQQITEIISKTKMDEQIKNTVSAITTESIAESTNYILASVRKMDTLLKGLSKLSKVGRVELTIETLDMNEMIGQIIESERFQAQKVNACVEYEHLPNCLGDKVQVNQVFSNLLDNALKYLDPDRKGHIKILARTENDRSIYSVEDNGIGITESQKHKVFEIFHRVDPEAKVKGEGLGLTTVRQIVERLDGRIWLESKPGIGSKFFIDLPKV